MTDIALVTNQDQAIRNIWQYQAELADERLGGELKRLMSYVHAWYAARPAGGQWLFAPSKFVGYADNTAEAYFRERHARDGRITEPVLRRWFHVVEPGSSRADALDRALRDFLRGYGHSGPRKGARICVPAGVLDDVAEPPDITARIGIDPAICGGRPHIRGTRVRVCDILQMMASGVSKDVMLADYPYLSEQDVRAALAYGAAAIDHRIVPAA
ncbi:MAG: DUF433 domain-containing protein [Defluviicoccus sp.]|nr:DUF433 domain-containing protein [Defluviicoccus sp.]